MEIRQVQNEFFVFLNDENPICRYYTYYGRTPIIEAMNKNILASETE